MRPAKNPNAKFSIGKATSRVNETLAERMGPRKEHRTGPFALRARPTQYPCGHRTTLRPHLDSPSPSLFTALQEQLGLKLESAKSLQDAIIIDHIEQPRTKP